MFDKLPETSHALPEMDRCTSDVSHSSTSVLFFPTKTMTLRFVSKTVRGCTFATCFVICVNDCFFEVNGVHGNSMSPTLSPDYHATGNRDLVLFSKFFPVHNLSRGSIVSFWKPQTPEELSVKRVVGLPGDTVYPDDRHPVSEVKVPFGEVWVEGDNTQKTVDSNDFGTVRHFGL